jgi:hypothetical protein
MFPERASALRHPMPRRASWTEIDLCVFEFIGASCVPLEILAANPSLSAWRARIDAERTIDHKYPAAYIRKVRLASAAAKQ